ncbi:E3 ubiquitin-protein ligase TRIM38 [Globicephala melas]|uniref:E3 ubiquitin-protein ligase TRIM38 n=1 Tax=Globicephala melas TaxID=9731 RepID=UPI00122F6D0F|nr:E3 ubiquitin-protein ligase TRIM38 [Globicephala melas]XP_030737062.1 E3 ubiquitin-protein ligase TRIM38 [Globicephala melas]XP_030737063.1 E3 ubiquitin-protein ligase TRIM38 [Globicephala melas]
MASTPITKKMREEATCSICLQLITEPVSISCGHSYCHLCIVSFCEMQPWLEMFSCPQCRMPFKMASLRPNRQLGNLIDAIKEMDQEMSCEEHGEKLRLFCEDEGQLICWRCDRGLQHKGHTTALVEDACQGYKEKLQEAVTKLRQLEEECMNLKVFTAKQITEWNEKIEVQKQKIQSDFKNLQSFLHEEEKSYLWKLEKEKEQTLRRLRDNEANLEQKSHELESYILQLEHKCQGSAQNLLQDVKDTLSRSWAVKLEQPEAPSLDLHTVCNVSELYFDVKKMLRSYQVSVTLDPDTAYYELILSEDRRQVTRGCPQENLDTSSRRFSALPCILGCEGFTSGKHYFEVDVGEGTGWDLGVCMETVQRDTVMVQTPQSGFWAIRLCKKNGYVALTSPLTSLQLREQPLVVGIFLDFEAGVVSFYNMTTGSHIFTFPKASFSDTLRPYFQVYQYSPLFLPPPDE